MDYRIINVVSTILVAVAWFLYWRSNILPHLRPLVTWLVGWCVYYGVIYSIAFVQSWDVFTVSAWLRPPLAIVFTSIAALIFSLARRKR